MWAYIATLWLASGLWAGVVYINSNEHEDECERRWKEDCEGEMPDDWKPRLYATISTLLIIMFTLLGPIAAHHMVTKEK